MQASTMWTWLFRAWVASEILVAVGTRTWGRTGEVRDRGTQLLLWVVIIVSLTVGGWAQHALPGQMFGGAHWLKAAGVLLLAVGLAVRWTAIFQLGRAFSANVAIRATQKLKDSGLYRYVRHPSYLGMLLIFLGIGIDSRNWISLAIVMIFPTLALLYRIRVEESALLEAFGEEYTAYRRTTKRLIPFVY